MNNYFIINQKPFDLVDIHQILLENKKLKLSDESVEKITLCRTYLDKKCKESKTPMYGINTGFGSLYNIKIDDKDLQKLQENLVKSHACGTGEQVPNAVVKLMLLLKIKSLSYGYSGVQLQIVERLIDFYNHNVYPIIYTQGSLGASGDLAPLAHLALPLIGLGEVMIDHKIVNASQLQKIYGWQPIKLQSKEGLALLNGTQFMCAYGVYNLLQAHKFSYLADVIAAISVEGFDGSLEPFHQLIHLIRPHQGQLKTAERIQEFLEDSELIKKPKKHVQDPYSFRCVPQVHGATKDTINFVTKTFLTEANAVTDNPNVFVNADLIISGGNFHGQPLALGLDFLGIAMAELGNISERRTYQLVSGHRHLPPFLVSNPGLNSGLMIPQYTAASIVNQNKILATPASVDSIESSNGQEDHVSMGANAATKAYKIIENVKTILAIELLTASQALHFCDGNTSSFLEQFVMSFREMIPKMEEDRILHDDIVKAIQFIDEIDIDVEELY